MDKDIKVLIVPDVHGRTFWKNPVMETLENDNCPIIFLGDYHDPYPYQFNNKDFKEKSIEQFLEIVELKKKYTDRITLLLGNHDAHYIYANDECRYDFKNHIRLEALYDDNIWLFDIGKVMSINDKKYTFTHAAILKGWLKSKEYYLGKFGNDYEKLIDYLNYVIHSDDNSLKKALFDDISFIRGGWERYGSINWADVREITYNDINENYYQIFGHTQLEDNPIISEHWACIDCRKVFYINSKNEIKEYEE